MKNQNKIKIIWNDARLFSPQKRDVCLTKMQTTGTLEKEDATHYLIKNPDTTNLETNKKHPSDTTPSFYLIPKGMVESVETYL